MASVIFLLPGTAETARVAVNNTGAKSISLLESVVIDGSSSIPTLFMAPKPPAVAAILGSAAGVVLGTGLQKTCASFSGRSGGSAQTLILSSLVKVPLNIATRSSSLNPGTARIRSKGVRFHRAG